VSEVVLAVESLDVRYGAIHALRGVSFEVRAGEIVTLIGSNGAGKSTLLRAISGLVRASAGAIRLGGADISRHAPEAIVALGCSHAPEGRRIFANLTVLENLQMGAWPRRAEQAANLERVFALFPRLRERLAQRGGTLSGGEQQMLAIGRALMSRPRLLLLDEPSLGLAPLVVKQIFEVIKELNKSEGLTVFLVEQNAFHALRLAHRGYVMVNGAITMQGGGAELLARPEVRAAYLEGGH
jgi:branched-chain amino acid transport system ATP-binding protein